MADTDRDMFHGKHVSGGKCCSVYPLPLEGGQGG